MATGHTGLLLQEDDAVSVCSKNNSTPEKKEPQPGRQAVVQQNAEKNAAGAGHIPRGAMATGNRQR